jgi:hypothetical protein
MNDALNTSNDVSLDDLDDNDIDDVSVDECNTSISIDVRRRLEEKIAERQLEKEMREFDFDF